MKQSVFIKFSVLLCFFGFISIFNSCDFDRKACEIEIIGIRNLYVSNYELDENEKTSILPGDTIHQEFLLGFITTTNFVCQIPFISACYATNSNATVLNPIIHESISVSLNKDIYCEGNFIEANSNLLHLENSGILVDLNDQRFGVQIYFNESFINRLTIEPGIYNISLHFVTQNHLMLSDSVDAILAFN